MTVMNALRYSIGYKVTCTHDSHEHITLQYKVKQSSKGILLLGMFVNRNFTVMIPRNNQAIKELIA